MQTASLVWRTETRKVDDLVPNAKNPRSLSAKQKADLEASITKFNLVEIPAVNTDNQVLAGHQRLKIMKALGRGQEEIDVRVPDRTLTDWKKRPEFWQLTSIYLREWMRERTPDVIGGLFNKITDGKGGAGDVKFFLGLSEWGPPLR